MIADMIQRTPSISRTARPRQKPLPEGSYPLFSNSSSCPEVTAVGVIPSQSSMYRYLYDPHPTKCIKMMWGNSRSDGGGSSYRKVDATIVDNYHTNKTY